MKYILTVVICCLSWLHCSTTKTAQDKSTQKGFRPGIYFNAIEQARKKKPIDFSSLDSIYTAELMVFIKSIDPVSDATIKDALALGMKNKSPHIQSQIISKTLQKVFFNEINALIQALKVEFDEKTFLKIIAKMEEYYAVISSTVIRRSEWIGQGRELDDICRMHLQEIKKSFGKKNPDQHLHAFAKTIRDTYILSVLYELVGIGENRGKNREKCEEKMVEGKIFLDIVEKYATDMTAIETLKPTFTLDYNELDVAKSIDLVGQAFSFAIPEVAQ